jgi:Zn-dependent M28 family amino/carboxypeptidase
MPFLLAVGSVEGKVSVHQDAIILDKQTVINRLRKHLAMLTCTIGERSVRLPDNIEKAAAYIAAQFEAYGLEVQRQTYTCYGNAVSNIVSRLKLTDTPSVHYVLGAHYDSVAGTVGADDNASAVAVLLETARAMQKNAQRAHQDLEITFVAFALEESPAYGTGCMGSRVFAAKAKAERKPIDGMICLEMVGYTCHESGCQHFPFPLQLFGYPTQGTFIGIVGNLKSLSLTRNLRKSFLRNPHLPVETLTVPFNGWILPSVRLSDHASFWNEGYRAVMVTDSAFFRNPHYHLPSDTMETLDVGFMADLVVSLVTYFSSIHITKE